MEFLKSIGDVSKENLLCVIAFNLPWAVELMTRTCALHLPDWRLVIFDNSNDPACRRDNVEICRAANIAYLGLPKNPEWSPNRSHALALNWVFRNVIRAKRPAAFGFLDHDCFPTGISYILDFLREQPVYGLRSRSKTLPKYWNLWAGFMFFNTEKIDDAKLDFNHDQIRGLDTGGRNWVKLYQFLDEGLLVSARKGMKRVESVDGGTYFEVPSLDEFFLHVCGASYRNYGEGYIPSIRKVVEAALAQAESAGDAASGI